jgi:hypothetical protein
MQTDLPAHCQGWDHLIGWIVPLFAFGDLDGAHPVSSSKTPDRKCGVLEQRLSARRSGSRRDRKHESPFMAAAEALVLTMGVGLSGVDR